MPILDNAAHEVFVQEWHKTNNKTEAYRVAYPKKAEKWKDATLNKRASELSLDREIAGRFKELQDELASNHGITLTSLLKELDEARLIGLQAETPQSSAAVSATMAKAKLVGLDITKIELSSAEALTPWGEIKVSIDG